MEIYSDFIIRNEMKKTIISNSFFFLCLVLFEHSLNKAHTLRKTTLLKFQIIP